MSAPSQSDNKMRTRRMVVSVLVSIPVGLVLLFLFDLFRPARAPSVGMLVASAWPHVPLLSLILILLLACWSVLRHMRDMVRAARLVRSLSLGIGLLLGVPLGMMMLELVIYDPLKFTYLIYRVESASTAEAERVAFRLADRWGRVWELNRISREHAPARARHLDAPQILEVEWQETWPTGRPYRAYRELIDERNMEAFNNGSSANQSAAPNSRRALHEPLFYGIHEFPFRSPLAVSGCR